VTHKFQSLAFSAGERVNRLAKLQVSKPVSWSRRKPSAAPVSRARLRKTREEDDCFVDVALSRSAMEKAEVGGCAVACAWCHTEG